MKSVKKHAFLINSLYSIVFCTILWYNIVEVEMNAQFKKGIIEMCILELIKRKDSYGYELVDKISKNVKVTENSIYPILRRLTSRNLFSTYLVESNLGAVRKYYKITEQGKVLLSMYKSEWTDFINGVSNIMKEGETI